MKVITEDQIEALGITPEVCVDWVDKSFRSKPLADMPPKISVHPFEDSFYTAMPCYHPDIGRVGVKVVSRVPGSVPSLKSKMLLYDAKSADLLALIDTNWITAMRTGAVAALAAKTFTLDFANASFGFVGLGVIARAVLRCLLSLSDKTPEIWLLEYKDHVRRMREEFPMIEFKTTSDRAELVRNTNALFSCVTVMHDQFLPSDVYPPGYTLIPVHVRGFQDCDIHFDKVYGDDTGHISGWQNFSRFKSFAEFSDVLLGKAKGRECSEERIISYNYGLGLHDLWYASRLYDLIEYSP